MAINDSWHRRCGPGGGTRRLHHLWGRNRIDVRSKDVFFARHCTVVIGLIFIDANIRTASVRNNNRRRRTVANRNGGVKVAAAA